MVGTNIALEYQIPGYGVVKSALYPYAAETYLLLDYFGHVDRMKEIEHLGVVKNIFEGVHHTRWEYVITQLWILNNLREDKRSTLGLGLSTRQKSFSGLVENGEEPTAADIIQMWALLMNAGHLPGTFASERAFLNYIKRKHHVNKVFTRGLPKNGQIRSEFENTLEYELTYGFMRFIILFLLMRYNRYRIATPLQLEKSTFCEFLVAVINYYFGTPQANEQQRKCKELFRKIRQIAYVYLDSKYCPIPIEFELSTFLINIERYSEDIFGNGPSIIATTLNSFSTSLENGVYFNPTVITEFGRHYRFITNKLDRMKPDVGIKDLEELIKNDVFWKPTKPDFALESALDLSLDLPSPGYPLGYKVLNSKNENRINEVIGKKNSIFIIVPKPASNEYSLNFSIKKDLIPSGKLLLINKSFLEICKVIKKLEKELEQEFEPYRGQSSSSFFAELPRFDLVFGEFSLKEIARLELTQKITSFVIRTISTKNVSVIIDDEDVSLNNHEPNASVAEFLTTIGNIGNPRLITTKMHESLTLGKLLESINFGETVFLTGNIHVFDDKRTELAEFDSLVLNFSKSGFSVYFVEAKKTRYKRSRAKKAVKELKRKFDELELFEGFEIRYHEIPNYGGYALLKVSR